jgi:hypothetical protein
MSSFGWKEEDVARMLADRGKAIPLTNPKPSKYHAVMEECDNIKFQSKKEAKYYRELRARQHAGEIAFFLMQVPFRLIGGVVYRCDFMEIMPEALPFIRFVDPKGHRTRVFINKKKQVEASYPIKIIEA